MKRFERPRTSTNSQPRNTTNLAKKDQKQRTSTTTKGNGLKPLNAAQLVSRVLDATASEPSSLNVNDSTTGSESSEVYDNVNVHYMDDANEKPRNDENLVDCEEEEGNSDESETETNNDSLSSSQGDLFSLEDKKSDRPSVVSKSKSSQDTHLTSKGRTNVDSVRSRSTTFHGTARKTVRSSKSQAKALPVFSPYRSSESQKKAFSSEAVDSTPFEEAKEDDKFEDALNSVNYTESDNEILVDKENKTSEVETLLTQKIGTLESRIEQLEEELRDVATLEMSLYSVFPKHGSSAHKLHRPARDLSRLYALARKNQSEKKLSSVAKNIVSGLFLVLKSCGSDVPRLTFWLSNTVMLREIISQEFGGSGTKLNGSNSLEEDWTDVRTLIAALRRVESCLFTEAVGYIWTQVMLVHMRHQGEDSTMGETIGNFSEPATCDRLQESFSVNLWKTAFEEALQRLCPIQAARRKCGCLHVLTRMVMEQCIVRLDVAMFNAILRESAHQKPTDPESDPIGDSRVLPIPAGVLSFESGVKLKNTVGNWSRLLTDIFEIDVDRSPEEEQHMQRGDGAFKPFHLLNELSDLLMLPKEMLVDCSTRDEVCPSIGLSLIKRILCNFTPDEFCPYPVPGTVLEELNAQSILESRSSSRDATRSFPRQVNPVQYCLPSCAHLTDMIAELSNKLKVSMTQNEDYSSSEEVKTSRSLPYNNIINGVREKDNLSFSPTNERYRLLGET